MRFLFSGSVLMLFIISGKLCNFAHIIREGIGMKRKHILLLGIFIIAVEIFMGCSHKNDNREEVVPEFVFTYAENQPEGYPTTLAAYRFADLVYERTQGRIKIRVHSGGSLGDEVSVIQQVQYGGIDFARASIMTMGQFNQKMNVLQLPYLYQDSDHMWSILDGEIGQEFMDSLKENGLMALSWYDAGSRHFYTTEAIDSLEDMKGKRIRVAESALMQSLITILGGVPVTMAYSDVFSALETDEIDGAENNWSSYTFSNHYEIAKYMTLDGHNRIPELQIASQATWDKLSQEDQKIIKECAMESSIYQRELWTKQEGKSRRLAERAGVTVIELSKEEMEKFREAVMPIYKEFGQEYQELIGKIIE